MTRDVIVVPPAFPMAAAWRIMEREGIRHLPVVRAQALIGMLSDRDILAYGVRDKKGELHFAEDLLVNHAMTWTPLETCEVDTSVALLARKMIELKIDAIPVVRGLHLVGLVTSTDLLRLLTEDNEARVLPFSFQLREETFPMRATA